MAIASMYRGAVILAVLGSDRESEYYLFVRILRRPHLQGSSSQQLVDAKRYPPLVLRSGDRHL